MSSFLYFLFRSYGRFVIVYPVITCVHIGLKDKNGYFTGLIYNTFKFGFGWKGPEMMGS